MFIKRIPIILITAVTFLYLILNRLAACPVDPNILESALQFISPQRKELPVSSAIEDILEVVNRAESIFSSEQPHRGEIRPISPGAIVEILPTGVIRIIPSRDYSRLSPLKGETDSLLRPPMREEMPKSKFRKAADYLWSHKRQVFGGIVMILGVLALFL